MSVRLEWTTADAARVTLHYRDERLADGNYVGAEFAVAIGTLVIEGTREQLRDLLGAAMIECAALVPGDARH